jgi:hypothetical protein
MGAETLLINKLYNFSRFYVCAELILGLRGCLMLHGQKNHGRSAREVRSRRLQRGCLLPLSSRHFYPPGDFRDRACVSVTPLPHFYLARRPE